MMQVSEQFFRLIEKKCKKMEADISVVERGPASKARESKAALEQISASLSDQLKTDSKEWTRFRDSDADPVDSSGGNVAWSHNASHSHLIERMLTNPALNINISDILAYRTRVISPPWDEVWMEGSALFGLTAKQGDPIITVSRDGTSAGGTGFYISTSKAAVASVTPAGAFDFSWFSVQDIPTLRSNGGMGMIVYEGSNNVAARRATAWSISGVRQFDGHNGGGPIADAVASPAWGIFGTQLLAPLTFYMKPNTRYLAWVYGWQFNQIPRDVAYISFLKFQVPYVTIRLGPPPNVR